MSIYHFLSKIGFARKKYGFKFFLIALPLMLLPLAVLIAAIAMSGAVIAHAKAIITVAIFLTIGGSVVMFILFDQMVLPLRWAKRGLTNYTSNNEIPQLPLVYDDEAGQLLTEIQTTIARLDTLITEKSDMIDLLSHDLRSPVGRILSLSALIKTEGEEKDLYADYIINECKGLLRVLENILLMLKEESQNFRLVSVNLREMVEETVGFFDFAIADKKLTVEVDIDEWIFILVQQDLFTQAVRNIVGNAIKFSSDGKRIFITASQSKEQIRLSIRDEGLGLLPADIERIFDRFTKAGKKGTRGEGSVGLGLYLCKKIVERHGGILTANSEGINKGATFTIALYKLIIKKKQAHAQGGTGTSKHTGQSRHSSILN